MRTLIFQCVKINTKKFAGFINFAFLCVVNNTKSYEEREFIIGN